MAFKHNTSDTADGILTQVEYESTSGHILDSQAAGDMIVADTTTTMTRLAVGSADEVLTSDGSTPTYSKITTSNINASTLVIESEGIGSNDNDTTIPTSAAVKDYVDTNVTAQDLDFTGDSGGPSAVDLDSQTLTISGTANEIETSVSGQTLTVGIVTNPTIGGNLTVTGDLTVNGTTTTVDTTNTVIQDPLIELNTGAASNANDLGIVMERGSTGDNAIIAWDESADGFIVGTTTATGASTGDLTIAAAPLTASTLTSDVITVDTINETTAASGVTIDSVLLKDGGFTTAGDSFVGNGNGLVVGHTSQLTIASVIPEVQVLGTDDGTDSAIAVGRWGGGSGGRINLVHSRAAIGSNTVTNNGDEIGVLNFIPDNGTNLNTVASSIKVVHNGTFSTVVPTDLILSTSSSSSANVEALRIDSNQNTLISDGNGLVVGHTSQVTTSITAEAQVLGTATADSSLTLGLWNTTNSQLPRMQFLKSGSGTIGSNTIVADGESLGMIEWYADDGTDYASRSAYIIGEIDGATGTNDVPGRLIFGTTADGANNPTEALRIDSSQNSKFGGGSTVTPQAEFDTVTLDEGGQYAGMSILSTTEGAVNFGDAGDNNAGRIIYDHSNTVLRVFVEGGEKIRFDDSGLVAINDTANANMTVGLTINQGANDNEILALKSSDVAHGMTTQSETDTYYTIRKQAGASGGIEERVLSEGTIPSLRRAMATTEDTSDTSTSTAATMFDSGLKSGTTITTLGNTGNIFMVRNNETARMLVKGNGDMHITNTTLTALDGEDDIALVRAYQKESSSGIGIAMSKWDEGLKANRADLIRTGVWSSEGDFTIQQRMNDLLGGAIWQMNTKHMSLAEEVKSLKAEIKALTEGR